VDLRQSAPKQLGTEKYNFTPTQEWLDHVRLSSVRLNDGGSGSFVSPHGLLLTNHHVARGQLQKNSTAEHDYIEERLLRRHAGAGDEVAGPRSQRPHVDGERDRRQCRTR
jgi:hypothetical protein